MSPELMRLDDMSGPSAVSLQRVQKVADIVDTHQVHLLSEQWRLEDGGHKTGRPGVVSNRSVLVLFHLLMNEYSSFSDTAAADLVMNRMSPEVLDFLDLNKPGTKQVWIARIRRARERCFLPWNPYRSQKLRRTTFEEAQAAYNEAKAHPDYRKRLERADIMSDAITQSSLMLLPPEVMESWSGTVAIDGTPIPIGSLDAATYTETGANPDIGAAWWAREGSHRAETPGRLDNKRQSGDYEYGYEADFMVMGVGDPDHDPRVPMLALGVRLKRPGHRPGLLALSLVEGAIRGSIPVTTLVTDQGIAPMAAKENLQEPLYDLGVDIVCDYPKGHRGNKDGYKGLIWVEGAPYCSGMPQGLVDATILYNDGKITEQVWLKRIVERRRYMAMPNHTRRRPDGAIQYLHPTDHGQHVCNPDRPNAPQFCRQKSILVPKANQALKYKQKHQYKSETWSRIYKTNRSTNEGFNKHAEDSSKEAIAEPDGRRIRGFAAQYVAIAMKAATINLRLIKEFLSRTPEQTEAMERKRVKRRAGGKTAANYRDQLAPTCTVAPTAPVAPLRT